MVPFDGVEVMSRAGSENTAEGSWLVAPMSFSTSGMSGRAIGSYQ